MVKMLKIKRRDFFPRLQNSRFFLKISKEIGNAWRKSLMRANRASLTRPLSPVSLSVFSLVLHLLFDCSRVLENAKIRTVLQSTFFHETAFLFWCHVLRKLGSSNCCIFETKHASGLETCTEIYFLFISNLV